MIISAPAVFPFPPFFLSTYRRQEVLPEVQLCSDGLPDDDTGGVCCLSTWFTGFLNSAAGICALFNGAKSFFFCFLMKHNESSPQEKWALMGRNVPSFDYVCPGLAFANGIWQWHHPLYLMGHVPYRTRWLLSCPTISSISQRQAAAVEDGCHVLMVHSLQTTAPYLVARATRCRASQRSLYLL